MKHILSHILAVALLTAATASAQQMTNGGDMSVSQYVQTDVENPEAVEDGILLSAEESPQFPGGDSALMTYIQSHIHYPFAAKEIGLEGRVVVKFVVQKDGTLDQFAVARGVHPMLDDEALRVIRDLPNFIPGKQNGEPVDVWYVVPVEFKL